MIGIAKNIALHIFTSVIIHFLPLPDKAMTCRGYFLNLLATSAEKLKNGTFAEKDAIARIWFLNLRIGEQKEVSYLCKTELKDLIKFGNVLTGGSGRT